MDLQIVGKCHKCVIIVWNGQVVWEWRAACLIGSNQLDHCDVIKEIHAQAEKSGT